MTNRPNLPEKNDDSKADLLKNQKQKVSRLRDGSPSKKAAFLAKEAEKKKKRISIMLKITLVFGLIILLFLIALLFSGLIV